VNKEEKFIFSSVEMLDDFDSRLPSLTPRRSACFHARQDGHAGNSAWLFSALFSYGLVAGISRDFSSIREPPLGRALPSPHRCREPRPRN